MSIVAMLNFDTTCTICTCSQAKKQTDFNTAVVGLNPCFSDPDTDRVLANRFQKIEKTMSGQRSYTICLTCIHICKSLFLIYEMRTEFRQHISENGKPGRFSQHGFNSTNTGISRFLPQREIYSYITTKIRNRFNMYLYMLHNSQGVRIQG